MSAEKKSHWPLLAALGGAMVLFVSLAMLRLGGAASDADLERLGMVRLAEPVAFAPPPLLGDDGAAFDAGHWRGQWSLVFFGFSHCPAICPTTMSVMGELARALRDDALGADTRLMMVSVDPERDTPGRLRRWLSSIEPMLRGVTGEREDIIDLARTLGVSFHKIPNSGPNYDMAHGVNIFVISPDGRYRGFIRPPHTARGLEQAYRGLRSRVS